MIMNGFKIITIILLFCAICISVPASTKSAGVLLQEGLYAEETEGDLDKAIDIYKQIVEDTKVYQRIAARALYQLGKCHLKKAQEQEAIKYFQAVVDNYPTQRAIVKQAKEQLVKFKPTPEKAVEKAVTTISTCAEGDPKVEEALESLKGMDETAVVSELVKYLDSETPTVKRAAIYILWKGGFGNISPAVEKLKKLCSHEEDFTRGMAAIALGAGKVESCFDIISNMTLNDPSGYARRSGAYAIGLIGSDRAVDVLKKAMNDSDPLVQENARYMLSKFGESSQVQSKEPVVISTSPVTGTKDVPASLKELSVTFNQTMEDGGWAWVRWDAPYPDITGKPSYDAERRTCTVPVNLKAGQAYLVAFNIEPYIGFCNEEGMAAKPYVLVFATKDENGNSTEIPQYMLDKAKRINSKLKEMAVQKQGSLQEMIDSADAGSVLVVPNGKYSKPVKVNKSLTLKGQSRQGCVFEITANEPAIFIDTKGKGAVKIENMTIKWQLATSDKGIENPCAVAAKDSKAEINSCAFIPLGNPQRSPIAAKAKGFSKLAVKRCRFEGFENVICFDEGTSGSVEDSLIMNCGHQGVMLYSRSKVSVLRNAITGSDYHAVRSTGGTLDMQDNLIIDNKNRGVYLGNKSAAGTIKNNVIKGNSVGISGFSRSRVGIENNVIMDSTFAGIAMEQSCSLTIRDNIFFGNDKGWVMFEKGGKGGNTCYRNTFWKNKIDAENFRKTQNSILEDARFVSVDKGDFSLQAGPAKENKQGLTNPEVFKNLWKIWQNRKNENEPFSSVGGAESSAISQAAPPPANLSVEGISVGGTQDLAQDDGVSAGKRSIAGSGHGVKFKAPRENSILKAIKIYGSRYGHPRAPNENFHVWLCDTDFNVIEDFTFPYAKFTRGNVRWVTLSVKETSLPGEFVLCAGFNPTRTKGVYVHYDGQVNGNSYTGLPRGMKPFSEGDWMIRAVVK
jgi:tetratricopeptide (TPR) repeat protein/nitrous oxidase accessory protein NosD